MAVIVGQGISVSPVADAELSHESTSTVQNKVVTDAIASEYSTSKTYSVGDVCTHDGKLYECIVDIPTAEGWTLSHWKVSNIGDNVSNLNRQLNDETTGLDTKAPVILETVSGAIASFSDGADSMPVKKLVAQIEPVQDLHGYDHPWPAGGGVNQWDEQWEVGMIDSTTGEKIAYDSAYRTVNYIAVTPSTSYYAHVPSTIRVFEYDANKSFINSFTVNNAVFTTDSNTHFIMFNNGNSRVYNNDVSINYPATVTTYSPYSNICQISGHTGAEIQQTGKNLLAKPVVLFTMDTPISDCFFMRAGNYVLSCDCLTTYRIGFRLLSPDGALITNYDYSPAAYWRYNGSAKAFYAPVDLQIGHYTLSFTLVSDCYVRIVKNDNDVTNAMIRLPSDTEAYEPYTGNQISVNWEDEAGTVYGGEDEVISGKLISTMGMVSANDLAWTRGGSSMQLLYTILSDAPSADVDSISEYYQFKKGTAANLLTPYSYTFESGRLYVHPGGDSTVHGNFVYSVATPIEYTTDPQTLDTFYGQNNIWANTGDVEVTYPADTKLYIDGKITQAIANALNS